jgi:hypothetical protein
MKGYCVLPILKAQVNMYLSLQHYDKRQITISNIPITAVPTNQILAGVIVSAVFLVSTWTTVFLRWFTRAYFVTLRKDDLAMLVTMVSTPVLAVSPEMANSINLSDVLYRILRRSHSIRALSQRKNHLT